MYKSLLNNSFVVPKYSTVFFDDLDAVAKVQWKANFLSFKSQQLRDITNKYLGSKFSEYNYLDNSDEISRKKIKPYRIHFF